MRVIGGDEVWRAAIHEAGHAVAASRLGLAMPDLTLEVEAEQAGTCGYALWGPDRPDQGNGAGGAARREAEAATCLAGAVAESIALGDFDEEIGEDDLLLALDLAEAAVADPEARQGYLDRAEERAESLLRASWPAVEAVADALARRHRLDAVRVRELIEAAAPVEEHRGGAPPAE